MVVSIEHATVGVLYLHHLSENKRNKEAHIGIQYVGLDIEIT